MATTQLLYVGIKGHVLAFDRTTGSERWRTRLKRSEFVHLASDGQRLYATTAGELFCLDPTTGSVLWQNPLRGMGLGLASLLPGGTAAADTEALLAQRARPQMPPPTGAAGG